MSGAPPLWIAIGVLSLAIATAAVAAGYRVTPGPAQGVADPDRAWQNYVLNCQGCHRPDGIGDGATAPALADHVGIFTAVPGGRDYLSRAPGAATAPITDAELAELLNWVLWKFDPGHVSPGFKPYTAAEVGSLRLRPLRTEAAAVRASLLESASR